MKLLISSLLFLCLTALVAQEEKTLQDYFTAATTAYKEKDYAKYLENLRAADDMRPNHPAIVPRLAAAWALNGRKIKSIQKLNQMMLMDASFDFEGNSEFDNIRDHKGYNKLLEFKKTLSTKVVNDEVFMTIDAGKLHPESFVLLENGDLLLGSIRERKIVRVDQQGNISDWIETPFAVMGMKADFEKGILWVASAAMPEMVDYDPSNKGKSIVLQINLADAEILQGISYDEESIIGDLVFDKEDRLWLSNTLTPFLSRDGTDSTAYSGAFNRKQFDLRDTYFNLQGLSLTDEEDYLYVADYISGIFRVDIENDKIQKVFAPETTLLKGIDGLYFYKNSLIAIHNGTKPNRVVRYFLNDSGLSIDREEVINRGGDSLGEPTLGQIKDGYFYYLANSPWPAYDREQNFDLSKVKPIEIRRIKLD